MIIPTSRSWEEYCVATKASMTVPAEVYRIDLATGSDLQLTFTNKNIYDVIRTGKVEERSG